MAWSVTPARRARPVADAPVEALLESVEDVAKAWVLALVDSAPLGDAPAIVSAPLVRDAPRICAAVVRALASEADLARLAAGGEERDLVAAAARLAGARDPVAAARVVDRLQDVLWAAIRHGSDGSDAELLPALAGRLAHVCAVVREAVLGDPAEAPGNATPVTAPAPEAGGSPPPPARGSGPPGSGRPSGLEPGRPDPTPRPGPPDLDGPRSVAPAVPAVPEPPLWVSALGDEIVRAGADAAPLALLLAELEDSDRVIVSASPERAGRALDEFIGALRSVLREPDILVRDGDTRAWVIARGTARSGAHSLGARIAEAVGETTPVGGVPLAASVGIAVLGEDGIAVGDLIEAAEEARFAASARGVEVARRPDPGA